MLVSGVMEGRVKGLKAKYVGVDPPASEVHQGTVYYTASGLCTSLCY